MNEELEKETPGIRLNVPNVEQTEDWIKRSEVEPLLNAAADLLGGSLTHQQLLDSKGNESKRYIIVYK